jgi:hypothetical protein
MQQAPEMSPEAALVYSVINGLASFSRTRVEVRAEMSLIQRVGRARRAKDVNETLARIVGALLIYASCRAHHMGNNITARSQPSKALTVAGTQSIATGQDNARHFMTLT